MNLSHEQVQRWKKLTATMDIPNERREPTAANLGWFFRNIQLTESKHPNIIMAWRLAKDLDEILRK